MIWFTSDLHFGHKHVIDFCKRPFANVDEMNNKLFARWEHAVKPTDTIYVLGDLSFQHPRDGMPLLFNLPGKKILIQGNHDKWSRTQYETCGFTVLEEATIKLDGHLVRLSHYPYFQHNDPYDQRYLNCRPQPDARYELLLCGHVHKAFKAAYVHTGQLNGHLMINVGVDVWNFSPVSKSQIISMLVRGLTPL